MVYKYRVFLKFKDDERDTIDIKSSCQTARDMAYEILKAKGDVERHLIFETLNDSVYVCIPSNITNFKITPMKEN